jgi:hypothetical protein
LRKLRLHVELRCRHGLLSDRRVAQTLSFPVGLLANSSAPGYGRIWRLPVNFTIDRAGRLIDNGWKDKNPSWTAERLEQVVTPLLTPQVGNRALEGAHGVSRRS